MDATRSGNTLQQLRRNLLAGLRLATGQAVTREDFAVSFDQGFWLLATLCGLELLIGYVSAERPAMFYNYGLNYLGAVYLLDLAVILLIARVAGAGPRQTGGLVIANLAVTPIYLVLTHLFYHHGAQTLGDSPGWTRWLLPVAWQFYILFRLLRVFLAIRIGRTLALAFSYVAIGVASQWVLPQTELWYGLPDDSYEGPYAKLYQLSVEDLFYEQPALLQSSLADLAAQRPGVADIYLLAVGGYGLEKVFLNEVEYVRNLFDERFDTRQRSLVLVNNVQTVDRYPLANRHNLRSALATLGERLDPDEDLLFLFMTSHGSKQHRFSVNFGPVPLDDLSPQQVRQALDDAGIRWRVILVSSCYSGGFIEPLKDPHTLIITAAAPDRQSFGCGAGSEFTDFGTAYFKHALEQQSDFIAAFDTAAAWIADKEQRERREASLPQRFVGAAIREKLSALSRRFEALGLAAREHSEPAACEKEAGDGLCPP